MSTQAIYAAVEAAIRERHPQGLPAGSRHLDIGAGGGDLIARLRTALDVLPQACDFHVERFALGDVECQRVDLNQQALPYAADRFAVVTSSEVVEHVENYRALLRDMARVLAPGGIVVLTTPNVLNAVSRVRYLVSGFANLFGPLPVRNDKLYSTGGHITPVPFFYLAHALLDAGFEEVDVRIDRVQRTSVFWSVMLAPFILIGRWRFMARERHRFRTLTSENEPLVARHFTRAMLWGRTIVVSARKPAAANIQAACRT